MKEKKEMKSGNSLYLKQTRKRDMNSRMTEEKHRVKSLRVSDIKGKTSHSLFVFWGIFGNRLLQ